MQYVTLKKTLILNFIQNNLNLTKLPKKVRKRVYNNTPLPFLLPLLPFPFPFPYGR